MSKNQLMHLSCSVALTCFAIIALPAQTFAADDIPDTMGSHTDGDTAYINGSAGDRADDTGDNSNDDAFDDDDSDPAYTSDEKPDLDDILFGYHCENPVTYETGHLMFPTRGNATTRHPPRPQRNHRRHGHSCTTPPSPSAPTEQESTSGPRTSRTRTSTFPRSSQSPTPPKPTRLPSSAARSQ